MGKYLDLGVFKTEDIKINAEAYDGREYSIPTDFSVEFIMRFEEIFQGLDGENRKDLSKRAKDMIVEILNLDPNLEKKIDVKYVDKYFKSGLVQFSIMKIVADAIQEMKLDENFNSPHSTSKKKKGKK